MERSNPDKPAHPVGKHISPRELQIQTTLAGRDVTEATPTPLRAATLAGRTTLEPPRTARTRGTTAVPLRTAAEPPPVAAMAGAEALAQDLEHRTLEVAA